MDKKLIRIDLIVEDVAHENLARAIIRRLAQQQGIRITISTSIKGGYGRVQTEIKGFQLALKKEFLPGGIPDLFIVMQDTNCKNYNTVKRELMRIIDIDIFPLVIVGCPDPHAERWFFADPGSLHDLFGFSPEITLSKCEKNYYKNALKDTIRRAGWPSTQGGVEFAQDIVSSMDFSHLVENDISLKNFINDIKKALKRMKS